MCVQSHVPIVHMLPELPSPAITIKESLSLYFPNDKCTHGILLFLVCQRRVQKKLIRLPIIIGGMVFNKMDFSMNTAAALARHLKNMHGYNKRVLQVFKNFYTKNKSMKITKF